MNTKLLLPLLVLGCTTGCATISRSTPPESRLQPVAQQALLAGTQDHAPLVMSEIGRPLAHHSVRGRIDWTGALGLNHERISTWPVVRSLRAIQPQAFDRLGITVGRDQVGLTFSTRF